MVDRLSRAVDRYASGPQATTTRRGFLTRLTLTATALAVAPVRFITRPASARATVTCRLNSTACPGVFADCPSTSSTCCQDYSAFCCTITGNNECPTGTIIGGWWKCPNYTGGGLCDSINVRYYLDCNAQCGCTDGCTPCTGNPTDCSPGGAFGRAVCCTNCDNTVCKCANDSCGNRKTGCVKFRYGQCNNTYQCLGAVRCRVVTCTYPPNVSGWHCSSVYHEDPNTCCHGSSSCMQAC
jgi:hypothetical protein